jgi:hypothetical protein
LAKKHDKKRKNRRRLRKFFLESFFLESESDDLYSNVLLPFTLR